MLRNASRNPDNEFSQVTPVALGDDPAGDSDAVRVGPLRVLLVTQHFWPESIFINEAALSLRDAGCSVSVLTGQPNYPDGVTFPGYTAFRFATQTYEGIDVVRVPLIPRGNGSAPRLFVNYTSFIAMASILIPYALRGREFDVVCVFASSPLLQAIVGVVAKRFKRIPLVTWVQDLWPESLVATGYMKDARLLSLVRKAVRWVYRQSDLIIVQSPAFMEPVRALAPDGRVMYLANPGPRSAANEEAPSMRLGLSPGCNIVFAGNFGHAQSLETIVEAAHLVAPLSDVRIVMVGSGARSSWLDSEVKRRGLKNIEMPGRFPPSMMQGIFRQASALLMTLKNDPVLSMTVPSKLQAYMAAGKPIIASLNGEGARVVATAGVGWSCEAENPRALADAIIALRAQSPSACAEMGRKAKAYFQQEFDAATQATRMIAQFRATVREYEDRTQ